MEVTTQNINVSLPVTDMKFFKELVRKMGWRIEQEKKLKAGNPVTIAAIKEARTQEAAGVIDTSSYDAFVNSILKGGSIN